MNALRTVLSALCIVIGALLIAAWAASAATIAGISESTLFEDLTKRAIASPEAQAAMTERGTEEVLLALESHGIDTDTFGVEALVRTLVETAVSSDTFANLVHAQAGSARTQVVAQLEEGGDGPIVVALDFSDQVNAGLDRVPLVGESLPEIAVPPAHVEVLDAETADTVRTTWHWLHIAQQWFGWLGLAFVAVGILVSHRKRWFFAKVALAVAVMSALVWAVMTFFTAEQIGERVPGGGAVDAILAEIVRHVQGSVATTMGFVAIGAMIVAIVLFALAARSRKGESP